MDKDVEIEFNTYTIEDIIKKFKLAQEAESDAFKTLEAYRNKSLKHLEGLTHVYNQAIYTKDNLKNILLSRLEIEKEQTNIQNFNMLKNKIITIKSFVLDRYIIEIFYVEDDFQVDYSSLDFETNESKLNTNYVKAKNYWIDIDGNNWAVRTGFSRDLNLSHIAGELVYELTEDQVKDIFSLSIDKSLSFSTNVIEDVWEKIKSIGYKIETTKYNSNVDELEDLLKNINCI